MASLIVVLALVAVSLGSPVGQTSYMQLEWFLEIVDTEGSAGSYASIDLMPFPGEYPAITYQEFDGKDLRFAEWGGSVWSLETIDSQGETGFYTSLNTDNSRVTVSYARLDASGRLLQFAERINATWSIDTIWNGSMTGPNAMASDDQGRRYVAFDAGRFGLLFASETGSAWNVMTIDSTPFGAAGVSLAVREGLFAVGYTTFNVAGQASVRIALGDGQVWNVETLEVDTGTGVAVALDSQLVPHVVYGAGIDLVHAYKVGTSWMYEVVDQGTRFPDVHVHMSMAIGLDDTPRLAYLVSDVYRLMYAVRTPSGWLYSEIERQINKGLHISLAIDSVGDPHLAYADIGYPEPTGDLWYATTRPKSNRPPLASFGLNGPQLEGGMVVFDASASTDPDGDALTYRWDFDGDGIWDTAYSPDPVATYTWGDDWTGTALLEVSDGELTNTSESSVTVPNVAPTIAFTVMPTGDEAESLVFEAHVTDPGSDDILYAWSGHCDGWASAPILYPNDPSFIPDPDPSPDIHPRDVTDMQTVVCGDDGVFLWSLMVEDDDGGASSASGSFDVFNLHPALTLPPPTFVNVDEGVMWTLTATAGDAGSDDLEFSWIWELGPAEYSTYFNDGVGPDPDLSPGGTFPFTATEFSSHTYGDDGTYAVTLRVEDDDNGFVEVTTTFSTRRVTAYVPSDRKSVV